MTCNKRSLGSGCAAIEGVSRQLGVIGTSNFAAGARLQIGCDPGKQFKRGMLLQSQVEGVTRLYRANLRMVEL